METKEINAHAITVEEVIKRLDTSLDTGLTEEEAEKRLTKYGLNELVQKKKFSALKIFLGSIWILPADEIRKYLKRRR